MKRFNRQGKIMAVFLIFSLCFCFLILKLLKIQVVESKRYTVQSVNQRSLRYVLDSGRGDILDRNGISLTDSCRGNVIIAFPALMENKHEVIHKLNYILAKNKESLKVDINCLSDEKGSRKALSLASDLKPETIKDIREENISGLIAAGEKIRYGPKSLASHLVGYLGRVEEKDIMGKNLESYSLSDYIGRAGTEQMFEKELRGFSPESVIALLDAYNTLIPGLGYRYVPAKSSLRPLNITLTIDYHVQNIVEKIMDKYIQKGAVVVMEPSSGDILAMTSRPRLNQNDVQSEENDFNNRALQNYHPGSIFKVVVAAAALESGDYNLTRYFNCTGEIEIGTDRKQCFGGTAHGEVTFRDAFAYSCNTTFIEVGLKLGRESIINYAQKLGLGQRTGFYPAHLEEKEVNFGYIPSVEEMPYQGHLANTVLGQDKVMVTPLQVAQMFSALANNGKMVSPRLVIELTTPEGFTVNSYPPKKGRMVLLPSTVNQLKYMLMGVTQYGTGTEAAVKPWITAGKTGTAQTGVIIEGAEKNIYWFAGFTPVENPEAVVVVLIEEGRGKSAALVYKEIMGAILNQKQSFSGE